jgi:membrane protein DedA with SNARE-associated domain
MLDWITNIMDSWGYLGIVLLMFLENIFPPIPSEVVMPLAGFTASQDKLNITFVIAMGTVGSVLGALPWYYAGRYLGEERLKDWADKYGKWITVRRKDIEKSSKWFSKHCGKAVVLCHLVPGIRTLISMPAGIHQMNLVKFLLYTALGAGFWVAVLAIAGYKLGQNYQMIERYLGPLSKIVLVILVVAAIAWFMRRKRKKSSASKPHRSN